MQGKTFTKGDSSSQNAAPVSSGQFSRQSRKLYLTSDPLEGTSKSFLQRVTNTLLRTRGALPGWEKGQPRSLDCVGSTAWHVRSPGVSSCSGHRCTAYPNAIRLQQVRTHLYVWSDGRGDFKDPKGYQWASGIVALETEEITQLSALPGLSEDPSVVGLPRVEEQQVPITTTAVHQWKYHTNQDSPIPTHQLIRQLESQGAISKTHSSFNSPLCPVRKLNGEWGLIVDYCGLNEVTLLPSAAVLDTSELQYQLESKAATWCATTDITNVFFSTPLAAECRPQLAFTGRGAQDTWDRPSQGANTAPPFAMGWSRLCWTQGVKLWNICSTSMTSSCGATQWKQFLRKQRK